MRIVIFTILISSVLVAEAQVTEVEEDLRKQSIDTVQGWQVTGNTGLTFSQVALKNWTAGGFNTFSVNGLLNLSVNYRKNNLLWENGLDVAYGVIRQEPPPGSLVPTAVNI